MFYALCDSLPGENFLSANLVLEGIVSVGLFKGERLHPCCPTSVYTGKDFRKSFRSGNSRQILRAAA